MLLNKRDLVALGGGQENEKPSKNFEDLIEKKKENLVVLVELEIVENVKNTKIKRFGGRPPGRYKKGAWRDWEWMVRENY